MGEDVRREAGGGEEERIRRGRERGWMGGEGGEWRRGVARWRHREKKGVNAADDQENLG